MMRKACISLIPLLLLAAPAFAEVVVIVRREAQPSGNYVRVCDIARVDGPEEQAREVALTVLGPAPVRGETREITRWDIETRLYEMGVNAKVSFSGNDAVQVLGVDAPRRRYDDASFQPLGDVSEAGRPRVGAWMDGAQGGADRPSAARPAQAPFRPEAPERGRDRFADPGDEGKARVARAIGDYLADRYRAGGRRADIEVAASVVGATDSVPASAHEILVEDAEGKIPGRAKLTLSVRDEADSPPRRVTVSADTEVFGLALVAGRSLSKGESLRPADVNVARVRMEWGQSYLPPKAKAVVGREAKRALRPGDVLLAEDAVMGEAVKRGQLVIVDTMGKGWRLQTKAKAHGGGAVGDIVTVEDLETRAKYPVRIIAPGTVSVVVNKDKIIYNRD